MQMMRLTQDTRDSHIPSPSLAFMQTLGFIQIFSIIKVTVMVIGLFG